MKHAGWYRLLLRVVGLILVAYAAPYFIGLFVLVAEHWDGGSYRDTSEITNVWSLLGYISPALQLALGLYLFINPAWLMRASIADVQGHCPACWYDLRVSPNLTTCPECGVRLPSRDPEPPEPPEPPQPVLRSTTDSPKPPSTHPAS